MCLSFIDNINIQILQMQLIAFQYNENLPIASSLKIKVDKFVKKISLSL